MFAYTHFKEYEFQDNFVSCMCPFIITFIALKMINQYEILFGVNPPNVLRLDKIIVEI